MGGICHSDNLTHVFYISRNSPMWGNGDGRPIWTRWAFGDATSDPPICRSSGENNARLNVSDFSVIETLLSLKNELGARRIYAISLKLHAKARSEKRLLRYRMVILN